MADNKQTKTETVAPAEPEQVKQAIETPKAEPEEEVFDKARAMATIEKLREEVKAKTKAEKRLAELEAEEAKRKEAEMTEQQKLQRKLEEAEARLAAQERALLVRDIATEAGLPPELATRLVGDDAEALREDAKKLLDLLNKTTTSNKKNAAISPTLPAEAQAEGAEARRKRILGIEPFSAFDPDQARKQGGGVIFTDK